MTRIIESSFETESDPDALDGGVEKRITATEVFDRDGERHRRRHELVASRHRDTDYGLKRFEVVESVQRGAST